MGSRSGKMCCGGVLSVGRRREFFRYKKQLIDEVNSLKIKDMPTITTLFQLAVHMLIWSIRYRMERKLNYLTIKNISWLSSRKKQIVIDVLDLLPTTITCLYVSMGAMVRNRKL